MFDETRRADEFLVAECLDWHGYSTESGELLSSMLYFCTTDEFDAWVDLAKILDERGEIEYNAVRVH